MWWQREGERNGTEKGLYRKIEVMRLIEEKEICGVREREKEVGEVEGEWKRRMEICRGEEREREREKEIGQRRGGG